MNNSYWDYLEHHGILGQKWGVRRGDHYPLNPASDYSAEQKKLNPGLVSRFRDSKSNAQKKEIQKQAKQIAAQKKELERLKTQTKVAKTDAKAEAKEQKRIEKIQDDRQKKTATQMLNNLSSMSDQEIRDYLNRVNMEKQLRDLARQEYAADHPVKTYMKGMASKTLKTATEKVANKAKDAVTDKLLDSLGKSLNMDLKGVKDVSKLSAEEILKNVDKYSSQDLSSWVKRNSTINTIRKELEKEND